MITFQWDETTGVAKCILTDGNKIYTGIATCAEDDIDMKSEKVGCEIAELRAVIAALKGYRDDVLRPGLAALNHLFHCMRSSKKFNIHSYEAKMLKRQIRIKKDDLETINEMISRKREELRYYITTKENLYTRIRNMRTSGQN